MNKLRMNEEETNIEHEVNNRRNNCIKLNDGTYLISHKQKEKWLQRTINK